MKIRTLVTLLLSFCLLMGMCVPAQAAASYVMEIGHAQPVTHPRHLSLLKFQEIVEEKTNGDIKVVIFSDAQLGNEAEMLESVELGLLTSLRGGQMDFIPQMLAFTLPFIAENTDDIQKLLASDLCKEICKTAEKDNMIILAVCDGGGLRNFSANKPIRTPADLVGMKMRSPGVITIDMTLKALGASSVTVPYGELYMALNTGVADGQENPYINAAAMKFYEVQKYFTEVNYQFHPDPFYINLDFWNSLPEEYQVILQEAADVMAAEHNRIVAENISVAKQQIIDGGAEVIELTEEERNAFREAVQPVYAEFVSNGYITQAQLDTLLTILPK